MSEKPVLGVIGGTGLYAMSSLEIVDQVEVPTPFGSPSGPVRIGRLEGVPTAFLARHGEGHGLTSGEINYRANLFALKSLGVERVVSVSACGSLRGEIHPGDVVVPDQLFDSTDGRARSFFGDGVVVHLSAPEPFCPEMSEAVAAALGETGARVHRGGTYLTIEGPRFSTRAESQAYRALGFSIIGMTTSPEAFLAREAELCYAVMAHVTDYDVWHESEAPVSVDLVVERLHANARRAEEALRILVRGLPEDRGCDCGSALRKAFVTPPASISAEARRRLGILVQHYLD